MACAQNLHWDLSHQTHVVFLIPFFFFFFFDETPCLPLTIKIIPQTLHFRDTLEADFIASVRSFFLPGMFITFKGDKE